MCLDTVDKEIKVKEGIGWKCFRKDGGHLYSLCFSTGSMPRRRWITDKRTEPIHGLDSDYPAGFHVHLNKNDAAIWRGGCDDYVVIPVKFQDAVATGTQNKGDKASTIVAREIRIFTAKEAREYDK